MADRQQPSSNPPELRAAKDRVAALRDIIARQRAYSAKADSLEKRRAERFLRDVSAQLAEARALRDRLRRDGASFRTRERLGKAVIHH